MLDLNAPAPEAEEQAPVEAVETAVEQDAAPEAAVEAAAEAPAEENNAPEADAASDENKEG